MTAKELMNKIKGDIGGGLSPWDIPFKVGGKELENLWVARDTNGKVYFDSKVRED